MSVSIVITTYNRRDLVVGAIDSALLWVANAHAREAVLVDDASTDGTLGSLREHYAADLAAGRLKLVPLAENVGVTGAKNAGAAAASGEWVLFLDSDDMLIGDAGGALNDALVRHGDRSVHFFRCVDRDSGELIGMPIDGAPRNTTLRHYLDDWKWGECLPVLRLNDFLSCPYEASLRGHEGLCYARLIKKSGPILLHSLVARRYDRRGEERLSGRLRIMARGRSMARGFVLIAREFGPDMGLRWRAGVLARAAIYGLVGTIWSCGTWLSRAKPGAPGT